MAVLDDLVLRLEQQGIGTRATDLFYHQLPESPDACVMVRELTGRQPYRTMRGVSLEHPIVQMTVRGVGYATTRAKALAAWQALDGFSGTLNGTRYAFVEALHNVAGLGDDENGRCLFSCSFSVVKVLS
jgi:hypothetical protein